MNAFLLLLPAALSLLVLAAHFLRRAQPLPMLICLALLGLLWVRRPWASRILQVALLAGALEWVRTAAALVTARQAIGEPWERMALILAIVASVAVLAALAFETPALRRRQAGMPVPGADLQGGSM